MNDAVADWPPEGTAGPPLAAAGLPGFDAIRERQLLERLRAMHRGPYEGQAVEGLFRSLLEMSRTLHVPTR